MNGIKVIFLGVFLTIGFSCTTSENEIKTVEAEKTEWVDLIDADLSQWDNYLSFKHKLGYDGSAPKNEKGELIEPVGWNKPGYNVFSVVEDGSDLTVKVTGEYYGGLVTKQEYDNYHFQLKFKWGDLKWEPREKLLKDSGILYHSIGPAGAEHWRSWMMSQEFQIMEGHTGDYWSQATSAIDIRAYTPEHVINPMAHESQEYLHLGEAGPYKKYCLRSNNYEKPHGEWNTLDLYCFDGKSLHVVNGEVVMILKDSRYLNEAGEFVPLRKGKIQLQSEAAEVFYKDVRIRNLASLDQDLAAYF